MSTYFGLDRGYWTDPDFEDCPPLGRLFYLYLASNRHCNLIGLYTLSSHRVMSETGLTSAQVQASTSVLTSRKKIEVHGSRYWIRAYLGRQKSLDQDLFFKGVVNEVFQLPDDQITRNFLERYQPILRAHAIGRRYTETDQKKLLALLDKFLGPTKDQPRAFLAPSLVHNANANANDSYSGSGEEESFAKAGPTSSRQETILPKAAPPEDLILAYWLERVQAKHGDQRTARAQTLTNIRTCLATRDPRDLIASVADYGTHMDRVSEQKGGGDPFPVKGSNFFGKAAHFEAYLPAPADVEAKRARAAEVMGRLAQGVRGND